MIVHAALQTGCSVLHGEGLRHGRRLGSLVIVDPFRTTAEEPS